MPIRPLFLGDTIRFSQDGTTHEGMVTTINGHDLLVKLWDDIAAEHFWVPVKTNEILPD
jgi:hypothetical protein